MTQRNPQPSPFDDPEMHRLFRALRQHVVQVLRSFTDGVTTRVDLLADQPSTEGPPAAEVFADSVVEASNMVVRVLRDTKTADEATSSTHQQDPGGSDPERGES